MVKIEDHEYLCDEEKRLKADRLREKYWKKWGPYVAERQWATGNITLSLCRYEAANEANPDHDLK